MGNNGFPCKISLKLQASFCLNEVARNWLCTNIHRGRRNALHPKFPWDLWYANLETWGFVVRFHELGGDCTDWKWLCFVTEECCALISSIKIWRDANSDENEQRSCSFGKCSTFLICANILIEFDWQMRSHSILFKPCNFILMKLGIINYPLNLLLTLQENNCLRSSGTNQSFIREPG